VTLYTPEMTILTVLTTSWELLPICPTGPNAWLEEAQQVISGYRLESMDLGNSCVLMYIKPESRYMSGIGVHELLHAYELGDVNSPVPPK